MAVKAPTTRKGRQTRQSLVEAAFDLFNEAGTADVRVTDISVRAGLSPAAFYRYFETKEEVLGEVIELFTARLSSAVRATDPAERSLPPFERFARANRRYVDAYARYGQILRIVEQLLVADPSFLAARRNLREAFVPRLVRTFRRLEQTGEIATDVDLDVAAAALSTMLQRTSFVMLVLERRTELHPRLLETVDLLWANALGLDIGDTALAADDPDSVRRWAAPARPTAPDTAPAPFELPPATSNKGRATRDALLIAARSVFERSGYLGARVADITAAAGVSHGTFYNYFNSRLDVFRVLIATLHDDLVRAMRPRPGVATASPYVRIRNGNRAFVDFYRANARLIAVLEQMATIDADLARVRLGLRDWFVAGNDRHLVALQSEGLVDGRLDPFAAAQALVSMVERMCFSWFVLGVPAPPEAADRLSLVWARAVGLPVRGAKRPARR